ncbi:hypothetical protein MTO96_049417 [Rhipicephalus appendiculatus]
MSTKVLIVVQNMRLVPGTILHPAMSHIEDVQCLRPLLCWVLVHQEICVPNPAFHSLLVCYPVHLKVCPNGADSR